MADPTTTNRGIPYAVGGDFIPNGPAEMEAIANALDAENRGEIDFLQAGVAQGTDWAFVAKMEVQAECKLESTGTTGGVAWLPLAAIGLVRSVTTAAQLKALKPAALPGEGKYLTVGFELTPSTSGGPATVSVVSGVEKATQAEAEAASPAVTAGKARIRDVCIKRTAGLYTIVSQTERRSWATGGEAATETVAEGKIGPEAVSESKLKNLAVTAAKIAAGTITTAKIKALQITEALLGEEAVSAIKLKKEAVTDAKVVKGRALINTEHAYSVIAEGNSDIPSATRPTLVIITILNEAAPYGVKIFCGGEIGRVVGRSPSGGGGSLSFICPPGVEWTTEGVGGFAETVLYTYLTL